MPVKYGKFEIPSAIVFEKESATPTFARFVAEPFERAFGHTIGNSIRRVLLSALEAPAIIAVAIEGVAHEFTAVDGILEDVTNIVLNLKGALLRRLPTESDQLAKGPRSLTGLIDVSQEDLDQGNGQVSITLGDVVQDNVFEVVNPKQHLFTVTQPMKRQIDLRVANGRGYVPADRFELSDRGINEIIIDAIFSPVRNVNYYVEHTRVGQDTDFDKLILEVTTDGRITPQEALNFASQILSKHLEVFDNIEAEELSFDEIEEADETELDEILDKLCLRVDEIELSVRSTNCLAGANIQTIAELVSIPERRMLEFRNFGKKSLNEIKAKLEDMELSLGMDVTRYGLDIKNLREQMQAYAEEKKARLAKNGVVADDLNM